MTDFSNRLSQVASDPSVFKQFGRGLEREALRYTQQGKLSLTPHPKALGSALTNSVVTTDFSESLLEFITPVSFEAQTLLDQLKDVHHFALNEMNGENLWPMSMPCRVSGDDQINLADYGTSNNGRMKHLYRQGLKHRYGSLMQIISGVHFNFSFPESFWDALVGTESSEQRGKTKSTYYFAMIRNYYRYGWIIPYLFGASPAICSSFLKGKPSPFNFEKMGETLYMPYATSLRLSDLGYTNSDQSDLHIGFNDLKDYLTGLIEAMHTPSKSFADIGVEVDGEKRQLNSNVLQIENELYAPIRPKRVAKSGEKPSEALCRGGVEYIEVRSLDVNPFSSVGITKQQIQFLDLFITWCTLKDSPKMQADDVQSWRQNWDKVVLQGRDPKLELQMDDQDKPQLLSEIGSFIFEELADVAKAMDKAHGGHAYQDTCETLSQWVSNPDLTISAQVMREIEKAGGIAYWGDALSKSYRQELLDHQYVYYSQAQMKQEAEDSIEKQKQIEAADQVDFDTFLDDYFSYLSKEPNFS